MTAIGFKGAVAVTVGGTPDAPSVLDRRVIVVRTGQPYHLARTLAPAAAEKLIEQELDKAVERATSGLKAVVDAHRVKRAGLCMSAYRLPSSLEKLLASHPACHAAEGQMTRDALIAASESFGLTVAGVLERDAESQAAAALRIGVDELAVRVAALGKTVGPPWRKDERLAACVALVALAG